MSGNMQSLRRKIDGAGDLQGVVRSMKALAASSIGQYEKAVQALDDYYRTVELGLTACLRQTDPSSLAIGSGAVWTGSRIRKDLAFGNQILTKSATKRGDDQ